MLSLLDRRRRLCCYIAMVLSAATKEWLEWVVITSIPLRKLDDADFPVGSASACLIDYSGRRFLLSVAHGVSSEPTRWAIEMESSQRGTEIFKLRYVHKTALMTHGTGEIRLLDLCFVEVPPDLTSVFCQQTPLASGPRCARQVFSTDLALSPQMEDVYAFSGHVMLERHGDESLAGDMVVYPGLKLEGRREEYHLFRLPVPHPGHDHFRGCSGAPIVNRARQLVAIVCSGDIEANIIEGLSLAWFKPGLDFLCASTDPARPLGPKGVLAPCKS